MDPDEVLRSLDFEDAASGAGGAGYQAAYSKLAASEAPVDDPVANVSDAHEFVARALANKVRGDVGGQVRQMIGAADAAVVGPFVQGLAAVGHSI